MRKKTPLLTTGIEIGLLLRRATAKVVRVPDEPSHNTTP
jgi:hypothetical protein